MSLIFMGAGLGVSGQSQAFSIMFPDARSAAMGSTGVASDPRNAVFYNPSLLATAYEEYDWYAIVPLYQEVVADPNDLENSLNSFLVAVNQYDSSNRQDESYRQQTQAALLQLEDKTYRERNAKMALLGVPSEILSGAFYVSQVQVFTVTPKIDSNDYSSVASTTVNSTFLYQGVQVTEMGFTSALPFTNRFLGDHKLGATLKLQLINGYGYLKNVEQSELTLQNEGDVDKASAFNFDLGYSKEIGVWKFGLAVQNIFKTSVALGDSGDTFSIDPQLKAGVAYRSRKTYLQLDGDLLPYQQFGVEEKSQLIGAGWEFSLLPWLFLRAGAQHDLGGNNFTTYTYGLGLNIVGFQFDAAASTNEEEQGIYGQLTLKF